MKYKAIAAIALIASSTPALAIGVEDLAKVVLNGNSVLKKAETTCGDDAKLSLSDTATLDTAVGAARKALVPERYTILEQAANAGADMEAESDTFCPETNAKRGGLLDEIKKAGKKLLLKRIGF